MFFQLYFLLKNENYSRESSKNIPIKGFHLGGANNLIIGFSNIGPNTNRLVVG